MADVLAADEDDDETADSQSFPPSPTQKPVICGGNKESVERAVRCANPVVVRAQPLSLV